MRRPVRVRLTVCMATVASPAVLAAVSAPAASADPAGPSLPDRLHDTGSAAPGVVPCVPPFGRKLA